MNIRLTSQKKTCDVAYLHFATSDNNRFLGKFLNNLQVNECCVFLFLSSCHITHLLKFHSEIHQNLKNQVMEESVSLLCSSANSSLMYWHTTAAYWLSLITVSHILTQRSDIPDFQKTNISLYLKRTTNFSPVWQRSQSPSSIRLKNFITITSHLTDNSHIVKFLHTPFSLWHHENEKCYHQSQNRQQQVQNPKWVGVAEWTGKYHIQNGLARISITAMCCGR